MYVYMYKYIYIYIIPPAADFPTSSNITNAFWYCQANVKGKKHGLKALKAQDDCLLAAAIEGSSLEMINYKSHWQRRKSKPEAPEP